MSQATTDLIFIRYSHKDKEWLERFQTHVTPNVWSRSIKAWSDTEIPSGLVWFEAINWARTAAKIAVLLVTQIFSLPTLFMNMSLGRY